MPQLLNYPRLDLTDAQETLAFRAIDRILRQDPAVKPTFGRSIYSWLGDALDEAEPSLDMCPWLRLTPAPGTAEWENAGQHRMPMTVGIEIAVAGTRVDNLMNAYATIRAALFPQAPAQLAIVQGIIQAAQITKGTLTKAAYGTRRDDKGNKLLYAMGSLELLLLVNT